ncbi:hypothetical protein PEL8287_03269 [Roseovarius litorisediminis]|uniref:Hedgehog/Intein (Hint) domain-containing protein n=1 Tax=Roseovarius litorisediminis TaxID=1312363 RepID=A0A1Y5TH39_9RHOB|nr:Hint domain-containing protein [Roseovarius litorisediminis]SLN60250.1 hypothetical protein PEL8287_03269 [Roseovarius litorisediminis]
MADPYFSELKFVGGTVLDFLEIAVDTGLDVSGIQVVVYNPDGTVRSTDTLGTASGTIAGSDIYVIDSTTAANFNGVHQNGAVALVQDGVVLSFLSFSRTVTPSEGPAVGLTSTALGTTTGGQSLESTDGGTTYVVQTNPTPGTAPCFQTGSLILTDRGYVPVETLKAGDLVETLDQGLMPLLWVGNRVLTFSEMANPKFHPVCIPAGSMALGVPNRDLFLSPNHRVFLNHPVTELLFHESEVLTPVKALVGYRGVGCRPISAPVNYHHLLFKRHQVVWSNGLPSESFFPDHVGLSAYSDKMQNSLMSTLPALRQGINAYGRTARMVLKPSETQVLLSYVATGPLSRFCSQNMPSVA